MKLIFGLTFAGALLAGFLLADKDDGQTADDSQHVAGSKPTESAPTGSTTPLHVPAEASNAASEGDTQSVEVHDSANADGAVKSPKWPDAVENMIFDYLSQLEGFRFTTITSVECEAHTCEIVFSGLNPNPTIVDDYSGILNGLYRAPINAQQGSIGTREIAAGAREFVISISNVPYVEPTVDQ